MAVCVIAFYLSIFLIVLALLLTFAILVIKTSSNVFTIFMMLSFVGFLLTLASHLIYIVFNTLFCGV